MDAQRFLAEFGHIANAPGGIARLRELILQLAISGRLVEPSNIGETVEESISAALKLKIEYEEKFKIRPTGLHSLIDSEPFTIPNHWQWARLHQLALYIQRGKGPKYSDSGSAYVVSQKCIQWSGFDLQQAKFISDESLNTYSEERFLCNDDLLWNSTGTGTAGRIAIYRQTDEKRAVADSHVTVIRLANFFPRYIWCVIASPWIQARIEPAYSDSLVSGTTQQVELATGTARALPIPCPPIEEQSRIVAKVDELMALCDKLEAQQQQRRTLQNRLRQAILQGLAAAANPNELQGTWMRLEENFSRLFQVPEDVGELRNVVLDLAFYGFLSMKNAKDEPTHRLLERCIKAKRDRIESGEMKRKVASATDVVEYDVFIPNHWDKAALEDLFQFIDYRGKTPLKTNSGVILITAKNVRPGKLVAEPVEYISERSYCEWMKRGFPKKGDLLITTEAPLGNVAIIDKQPNFALAQRIINLQPFSDINTKCIMYFLMSPSFQKLLEANSSGMTAKGIKASKLKQLKIPVPPKEEQNRIVNQVEELMQFSETLEEKFKTANALAERVAVSMISIFTGFLPDKDNNPMKAPKIELIAPLRLGTPPNVKEPAPLASILAHHHGEMQAKDLWQRFGGEIDAFYAQLKLEVKKGWILEPQPAEMRQTETA